MLYSLIAETMLRRVQQLSSRFASASRVVTCCCSWTITTLVVFSLMLLLLLLLLQARTVFYRYCSCCPHLKKGITSN